LEERYLVPVKASVRKTEKGEEGDTVTIQLDVHLKIEGLSVEEAYRICRFPWGEVPFAELMLYTMRHVQEHAAQLHLFSGQQARKSTSNI
jgi:hypothetical protein